MTNGDTCPDDEKQEADTPADPSPGDRSDTHTHTLDLITGSESSKSTLFVVVFV